MHYFLQHIISKYIFQLFFANIPKRKRKFANIWENFLGARPKKHENQFPLIRIISILKFSENKKRQTVRHAFLNIVNSFQSFLKIVNKTCHDACCGRISPHFNLFKCRCSLTSIFCACEHITLIGLHFIMNH